MIHKQKETQAEYMKRMNERFTSRDFFTRKDYKLAAEDRYLEREIEMMEEADRISQVDLDLIED